MILAIFQHDPSTRMLLGLRCVCIATCLWMNKIGHDMYSCNWCFREALGLVRDHMILVSRLWSTNSNGPSSLYVSQGQEVVSYGVVGVISKKYKVVHSKFWNIFLECDIIEIQRGRKSGCVLYPEYRGQYGQRIALVFGCWNLFRQSGHSFTGIRLSSSSIMTSRPLIFGVTIRETKYVLWRHQVVSRHTPWIEYFCLEEEQDSHT